MKRIILIVNLLGVASQVFAQENIDKARERMIDSVKLSYLAQAAFKYPAIRQANLSTEFRTSGKIRSKLYGQDSFGGKAQLMRVRANFTVPVAEVGKYKVTTTLGVLHQRVQVEEGNDYHPKRVEKGLQENLTTLSLNASITRADSLFNLPVMFNLGVSGLMDPGFSKSRFNVTGLFTFQIKRTALYSLSAGALLTLDPASPLPLLPFLSYSRKLEAIDAELFADMPSRLIVRKEFSPRSALSFGGELSGDMAFFNLNHTSLRKDAIFTTLDLKTGFLYEHLLSRKLVLGVNAGMATVLSSRVLPYGQNPDDYFIKNRNGSVPYLEAKLSFLPFWSGFKLR